MTRQRRLLVLAVTVGVAVAVSVTASAADSERAGQGQHRERLSGFAETPVALSTPAGGQFRLRVDNEAQEITWQLSYSDIATAVTQAHVHFGSPAQSGGISFFLCTNQGNGPAGTQPCPVAPASISGTITPAEIVGPAGQGIAAGEFAELAAAVRAGFTYVNVHSAAFPLGEIRAQLDHHH